MSRLIPALFDDALLNSSAEKRLDYFARKTVAHPHLQDASGLSHDNIEFAPVGEIVAIIGPSEVGTSALGRSLWRRYRSHWPIAQANGHAESMVRCIGMDAPSSAGRIDLNYWKSTFKKLLENGGDILTDRKLYVPAAEFQLQHTVPLALLGREDIDTLQAATLSMLRMRGTNVVLINQAERLFPEHDKAGCTRSQQMLYDLATQSQARIVLIANYGILKTTCIGGDWLQRRNVVHMRRYDRSDASQLINFNSTLDELLGNIPSQRRLDRLSESCASALYVNSIGCIGSLKKTLTMAVSHSLRTQEKITEELLLKFRQPNLAAAKMATEAIQGEKLLVDIDSKDVERILDASWKPDVAAEAPVNGRRDQAPRGAAKVQSYPARVRIGERTPTRDPVGGLRASRA